MTQNEYISNEFTSLLKQCKQVKNNLKKIDSIINKCILLKNNSFYYDIEIYMSVDTILIAMQDKKKLLTNLNNLK